MLQHCYGLSDPQRPGETGATTWQAAGRRYAVFAP
jgi:hypothetical protein